MRVLKLPQLIVEKVLSVNNSNVYVSVVNEKLEVDAQGGFRVKERSIFHALKLYSDLFKSICLKNILLIRPYRPITSKIVILIMPSFVIIKEICS